MSEPQSTPLRRLRDFIGELWPPLRLLLAMIGLAHILAGFVT